MPKGIRLGPVLEANDFCLRGKVDAFFHVIVKSTFSVSDDSSHSISEGERLHELFQEGFPERD